MSVAEILYILSGREKGLRTFLCPAPKMVWAPTRTAEAEAGRLRRHWHREGSQHAEAAQTPGAAAATSREAGQGTQSSQRSQGDCGWQMDLSTWSTPCWGLPDWLGREEPCRQSLFHLKHLCWAPTISQALSEVLGLQERMEISIESTIALPSEDLKNQECSLNS